MNWTDKGILLSKNKFQENSTIVNFYTKNHGKCSGIIFGASSKKIKNYFPESIRADKKVYAKTGTLRHNHNLSGYWIDEKGQVFAFSIMVNHHISSTNEISKGINELLEFFQKKIR